MLDAEQLAIGGNTYKVSFKGNVKSGIQINGSATATYTKLHFSTVPTFSERTKEFYNISNINNYKGWGELIIEFPKGFYGHNTLSWYNKDNDISEQKMEIMNNSLIDTSSKAMIYRDSNTKEYPSGLKSLHLSKGNYLSIPIHENDIGKQNNIDSFSKIGDNSYTINLTII